MREPEEDLPQVYVQPGESHLVTEPALMHTLLGSCVGIAFWAPRSGIAALCHPMLPSCPPTGAQSEADGRRYVDYAIRDLACRLEQLRVARGEVQVKLFGGADVLMIDSSPSRPTVGRLNSETALRVLREEGFQIAASSLGGNFGCNIQFNTETGEVLLRRFN